MNNTPRRKTYFLIALVSVLIAIAFHLYLNKHHVDVKLGTNSENAMCNVSEKLNCDAAAASQYSEVFGIPVALLGVVANTLLLLLLLMAYFRWTEDNDRTERYAFYTAGFIFLVSLIMGSISLFILKVGCPFCMGTYAASLVTMICLWLAFKPNTRFFADDLREAFTTQKWLPITLVVLLGLGYLVHNMVLDSYGYQEIRKAQNSSLSDWSSSPLLVFDQDLGLTLQKGTSAPRVVLVEFADFLCSHCQAAAKPIHSFVNSHPDVKLVYKPFPLDGVCNPAINAKRDGKSCELAYAALCAEKISKKGWDVHGYIFENQESIFGLSMEKVTENICTHSGIDCAQLKSCMNSDDIHEVVRKTASEGGKAQINGTPSVFLNNKLLPGGQLLPVLEHVYKNGGF